jgi:uncharacterized protein (TIGR02246 family)
MLTRKVGGTIAVFVAALQMAGCRAEIRGTVVGDSGPAAVSGASVTILGPSLPEPRRTVSDSLGRYSFTSLKPGRYTVETSLQGWDASNHELILTPGSVVVLELVMWHRPQAISATAGMGGTGVVADERAVRLLVTRYEDATEKRDPQRFEGLLTADADQLTTSGEWLKGRDNVIRERLASSQANPGSGHIAIEGMQFVAPDAAIVSGRYDITEGQAALRRMRTTLVVVRGIEGEWRIAAIRNMTPTDPAR